MDSFRKIFGCCLRESVSCVMYYCQTLPMSYIIDQRKILFWKKALTCDNVILRTLACISKLGIGMTASK